ncbi:CmNV_061-like protein [Aratus pisonii nudivirus]|nr:CmNV_061-like protein [Aratus pisonii nudivirus]
MFLLNQYLNLWKEFGDHFRDDSVYLTDKDFNEYFTLVRLEQFTVTIFEYLEGEYGFSRNVYYKNFEIPSQPLFIDYKTQEMYLLEDVNCNDVKLLIDYNLTIFNSNHLVTTSNYLKLICIFLFSSYKNVEGICYVCNDLIRIISYIIPQFIELKKDINSNRLSLPFSLQFLDHFPLDDLNLSEYHSQIDNLSICLKDDSKRD